MAQLNVANEIAQRLRQIAEQENRSLDDLLRSMLDSYPQAEPPRQGNWALRMAEMAQADRDIEWNERAADLAERSREILNTEFAGYLLKRMQNSEADADE